MIEALQGKAKTSIGYPLWNNPVAASEIAKYSALTLNNLGDPFEGTNYAVNSMEGERQVIRYFQKLLNFPGWGYVTCGSSISNLHAIYVGREKTKSQVLRCSSASHYSILSAAKILGMQCETAEADYKGRAVLTPEEVVVVNAGTTMTGAIDVIEGDTSGRSYIHIDAALSGMILPFVDGVSSEKFAEMLAQADSVCVSGHKMPGVPIPCSVLLFRERPNGIKIEYIDSTHSTVAGSRSGHAALSLLAATECPWVSIVSKCLSMAQLLTDRLNSETPINAWRHDDSVTVVFDRLSYRVEKKWQLASQGRMAHAITMPHVTEDLINQFVQDVKGDVVRSRRRSIFFHPSAARRQEVAET